MLAGGHRQLAVPTSVRAAHRVPEADVGKIGLEQHVVVRIPAVVERETRDDERLARSQEEVDRRRGVDAITPPDLPDDAKCRNRRVRKLIGAGHAIWIVKLREHERVDPLRVADPFNPLGELRPDVANEFVPHTCELPEVTVVRERNTGTVETERVEIGLTHDLAPAVCGSANVRDKTGRRKLAGQATKI